MRVFIAGKIQTGVEGDNARMKDVNTLSQIP